MRQPICEDNDCWSAYEESLRTMSKMPEQKPGRSEQVVCTPVDFLSRLKRRLGINEFTYDLAADKDNTVAIEFYSEADNSLSDKCSWVKGPWAFCNPPYGDIDPWVDKASMEVLNGAHTAMLVPASVGSNWWLDHVEGDAYITFLNGRITFVGHTSPYPKDLAVLLYAPFIHGGSCIWSWK